MKNLKVSSTGKFSGTRTISGTTSKYGSTAKWTLKISGKFTTPTKAQGTFTGGGDRHARRPEPTTIRSGKQTFKLKFYR